jgi:hypothetical protein
MRVDFAHAVGSRLLICGWVLGLADTVASATLTVGQTEYDLLAEAVRLKRTDVSKHFSGERRARFPRAAGAGRLGAIDHRSAPDGGAALGRERAQRLAHFARRGGDRRHAARP